jgi:hypothetical protein
VPRIRRPAVGVAHLARKPLELLALNRLVVALLAGALELASKKQLPIAAVRDLMVRDRRRSRSAGPLAGLAPGDARELALPA